MLIFADSNIYWVHPKKYQSFVTHVISESKKKSRDPKDWPRKWLQSHQMQKWASNVPRKWTQLKFGYTYTQDNCITGSYINVSTDDEKRIIPHILARKKFNILRKTWKHLPLIWSMLIWQSWQVNKQLFCIW